MVILLVEDDRQRMLIYKYLINCGHKRHELRVEQAPSGRGSAVSWVRQRFVKETNACRRRQARAGTALIVMIDADAHTVQRRLSQLNDALTDSGTRVVAPGERIARLVPRRNVETWILCLNEHDVLEDADYKGTRDNWNELIPPASQRLCRWTRPHAKLPKQCVPSLRTGIQELKRLEF
jgi:hypothetical protein